MTLNARTCAVTKLLEATALCVCRPDALDGALRRPGRFDRELLFPLPNVEARASILEIHTRGWAQPPALELRAQLAGTTAGYCGADLKVLQGVRRPCPGGAAPCLPDSRRCRFSHPATRARLCVSAALRVVLGQQPMLA